MSTMIDTLAETIRDSIAAANATREEWERALDQAFGRPELDPLERKPENPEFRLLWEIDQDGASAAEAAVTVWQRVFCRGPWQPSNEEACVFTVTEPGTDRRVEIDLSEERFAHLFPR